MVDDAALADPGRRGRAACTRRGPRATPVVVELAVDPAAFRAPESLAGGAVAARRRLRAVGRPPPLPRVGQQLRRPRRRRAGLVVGPQGGAPRRRPRRRGAGRRRAPRRHARRGSTAGPARRSPCRSTAPPSSTASRSSSAGSRRSRRPVAPDAPTLAPDQLAAVAPRRRARRGSSPRPARARPGCSPSGCRHLLADRGYEREAVLALAYNKKAQEEMAARTAGPRRPHPDAQRAGATASSAERWAAAPSCSTSARCASIVERLVPTQQRRVEHRSDRARTSTASSLIRLGLRDPEEVEDDARRRPRPGGRLRAVPRRAAPPRRRSTSTSRSSARVEALLRDGELRRAVQADHRHLLVDELQDLTPAHVLLVRLRRAPASTCSGSATTTRCIYGHAGADPRVPHRLRHATSPAPRQHALEVNYRCPAPVTDGGRHAARRTTDRRVAEGDPARARRRHRRGRARGAARTRADAGARGAGRRRCTGWLAEPGVAPADDRGARPRAVAAARAARRAGRGRRARSTRSSTRACSSRLGVRAALAYLRIAVDARPRRAATTSRGAPPAEPGPAAVGHEVARPLPVRSTTSARPPPASTT